MALLDRNSIDVSFKNIELLKHQTLGIGSFGAVCRAKCDSLICAAKILHPTLVDVYNVSTTQQQSLPRHLHRQPSRRFELECEFLCVLRHPNIVQFLGLYYDPTTDLPVILMELMDVSLTNYLKDCSQPVLFHIQIDLCHDMTLALSYLHSNKIIHRDLSGNNVLLVGNYRAKLTDFGMARLHDQSLRLAGQSLTMCPGTDVYMPPETVESTPLYNEKIDCFSFGVITLQVLTRQFPSPEDRRRKINLDHPGLPAGTLEVRISEIDRRQNHIILVDPNHPLLQVVFSCLNDIDKERPSSEQLCVAIGAMKQNEEYTESIKNNMKEGRYSNSDKNETVQSLETKLAEQSLKLERVTSELEERELTLTTMKREIVQLDQQLEQTILDKEKVSKEVNTLTLELEATKQVIAEFQQRFSDLKPVNSRTLQRESLKEEFYNLDLDTCDLPSKSKSGVTINWRVGKNLPVEMCRWCDAVVNESVVYFKNGFTPKVVAYDFIQDKWCDIIDCCYQDCTLCIVNNLLTTVGGWNSNQVFSLVSEINFSAKPTTTESLHDCNSNWSEIYPPMPTKRCWTTCFSNKSVLLVVGGEGITIDEKALGTVEVMDIDSKVWSTASSLPCKLKNASVVLSNDHLYILGGRDENGKFTASFYHCQLSILLESAESSEKKEKDNIWCSIASLPLVDCAFVSVAGHLLSFGGRERGCDDDTYSTAVNLYQAKEDSWEIVSNMSLSRSSCFAVALPGNQLMVAGGMMIGDICTKTVKFATVEL